EAQRKLRSCSDEEICESLLEDPRVYLKNCSTGAQGAAEDIGEDLGTLVFDVLTASDSRSLCVQNTRLQELFVQEFNRDLPSCLQQKPNLAETIERDCEQLSKLLQGMFQHQVEAFKYKSPQIEKSKQDPCFQEWTEGEARNRGAIHLNFSEFKKKLQALVKRAGQVRKELMSASACYKSAEIQSLMCSGSTYLVADILIGKGKNSIAKVMKVAQKANPKMDDLARVANNLQEREAREARIKRRKQERGQRISLLKVDPEVVKVKKALELYKKKEGSSNFRREQKLLAGLPKSLEALIEKNSGMKIKKTVTVESNKIQEVEARYSRLNAKLEELQTMKAPEFLIENQKTIVASARAKLEELKKIPPKDFEIELDLESHPMLKGLKEKWGVRTVKIESGLEEEVFGTFDVAKKSINISPRALLAAGGDLRLSDTFYHEIHHAMVAERRRRLDKNLPKVSGILWDNNSDSLAYSRLFYLDELSAHSLSLKLRQRGLGEDILTIKGENLKKLSDRTLEAVDSIKKERSWKSVRPLGDDQVMLPYGKKYNMIIDVRGYEDLPKEAAEKAIRDRLDELETYARKTQVQSMNSTDEQVKKRQKLFDLLWSKDEFP
ncbi:MAG: hypothetical protein WCH11_02695, partial [Bdellovibrio sp.]